MIGIAIMGFICLNHWSILGDVLGNVICIVSASIVSMISLC
jgi:hypothetical protein